MVIVGSANLNPGYRLVNNAKYPNMADDFMRTFRVLKSLPCDVYLGAHGAYYGMEEKYRRMMASGGNPFIDPEGYRAFVTQREKSFLDELKSQRNGSAPAALQPR